MALTKVSYSMITGASVNVLDFGADASGANDSKAAFDAALATGKPVFVPEGTFKIVGYLSISTAGQSIFGQSRNSIISFQPNSSLNGIIVQAFDVTISTLTFKLNANVVRAINLALNAQRGTLFNCFFEGTSPITTGQIGVYADGSTPAIYLWKVNSCDFAQLDVGIYLLGPDANAWHIDSVNFGAVNQGIVSDNAVLNTISNVFHQTPGACVINLQSGSLYNSITNIIGESNTVPIIKVATNCRYNRIFGVVNSGSSVLIEDNSSSGTDTNYFYSGELNKISPTPAVSSTSQTYNTYGTKVVVYIVVGATPTNIVKNSIYITQLTNSSLSVPLASGEYITVSQTTGVSWTWWKD